MVAPIAPREVTTTTAVTRRRTRTGTHMITATQVERRSRGHGNQARGGTGRGRNDGKNRHGRCNHCLNSTKHGWHDCPLRFLHQQTDETQHDTHVSLAEASTAHAWCTTTENADLECFQVVVGDGAECSSSQDKMREDGKNTQVHEDK